MDDNKPKEYEPRGYYGLYQDNDLNNMTIGLNNLIDEYNKTINTLSTHNEQIIFMNKIDSEIENILLLIKSKYRKK